MSFHKDVTAEDVHIVYRQVFADSTARLADATSYVTADLNKKALQEDDNSEWRLTVISPIEWTQVNTNMSALDHDDLTDVTADQHHNQQHALGGPDHTAATLAELNDKVSDATLDGSGDPRNDPDAIHDNVAGEIAALSLVTAAAADHLLIEDAGDSNNKKRIAVSDLQALSLPFAAPGTAMLANQILLVTATGTITFPEEPPEGTLCGILPLTPGERTVDASAEGAVVQDAFGTGQADQNTSEYPMSGLTTIWEYTTSPGLAIWTVVGGGEPIPLLPFDLPPSPVAAQLLLGRTNVFDTDNHTSLVFPSPAGLKAGASVAFRTDGQSAPGGSTPSVPLNGNGADVVDPVTGVSNATTSRTAGVVAESYTYQYDGSNWKPVSTSWSTKLIGRVSTTDATETSVREWDATINGRGIVIRGQVQAFQAAENDAAVWGFTFRGHRTAGGVVTADSLVFDNGAAGDKTAGAAAWTFAIDASGSNLRLRVTGEAAHDIDWSVNADVMESA